MATGSADILSLAKFENVNNTETENESSSSVFQCFTKRKAKNRNGNWNSVFQCRKKTEKGNGSSKPRWSLEYTH